MQQVSAYAPRDPLSSWMKALPQLIQLYLSRWHIRWTGESLKQGYFSYVLPCRCQDGTHAILKLSPLAREVQEQVIALSAWEGCGAAPLLAESFENNGAAIPIGRIVPGVQWRPLPASFTSINRLASLCPSTSIRRLLSLCCNV